MQEIIVLLENMLRKGFCLHGSCHKIEGQIEPRQANCQTGKPEGNQEAVYACKNNIVVPCVRSMTHRIARSSWSSWETQKDGTLLVEGENIEIRPGFIYVLPTDTFYRWDTEFISHEPVTPHAVVHVTPSILQLFPNLDLRIPISTSQ